MPPRSATEWHRKSAVDALKEQKTSAEKGLDNTQIRLRAQSHGPNLIENGRRRTAINILLEQFKDFMILVLAGAAIISAILGEPQDVLAILAIIAVNSILGFVQGYRAERAIEALRALSSPHARVRRNGEILTVPAYDLVPGDIVILEAGGIVPADLRVIEAVRLTADESALTGESAPVSKTTEEISASGVSVPDQTNMAFRGTMIQAGRGLGVVVGTGMNTELGKIANLLREEVEIRTPLQRKLAALARRLAVSVLVICLVILVAGLLRGGDPILMVLTSLSIAVAAIPEALPAVVTLTLAFGARRMSARNALVRKLPAVETLGSITYVCSDKTGTLTQNRMQAVRFRFCGTTSDEPPAEESPLAGLVYRIFAQNNESGFNSEGKPEGDPTEIALLCVAAAAGFDKKRLDAAYPRIAEIPFASQTGRMSTVHLEGSSAIVFTKGAPESVLGLCTRSHTVSGVGSLDRRLEMRAAEEMAGEGLRVLAFAYKRVEGRRRMIAIEEIETELVYMGLVGLLDPPRPEVRQSLELARSAGIRVVMITGDHPATAKAIGMRLGIRGAVMSGRELASTNEKKLSEKIHRTAMYARVAPEQKIQIVRGLQEAGEIVAMTGDGVNDAPALKRADIGVAMGKGGTDVARESAHLILLDDNFATIIAAVREGRRIYDNIRKFVRFALSGNSGEILTLFVAPFIGLPMPLLPIHILWVNLVTDGLPGLALAVEKEEPDIMSRPPRRPEETVFARGLWQHVIWVGLLTAGLTIGMQAWAYRSGNAHWQSMTFTVLTLTQMGHVLAIRSERMSILTLGFASNPMLLGAVVLTLVLQLLVLYVPVLNRLLKTTPLTAGELLICFMVSSTVFVAVEIEKWLRRNLSSGF